MKRVAIKHDKVSVVTVGAGWTAAMLAARLCPTGVEMVSLEQGSARWTYPHFAHNPDSLRYSRRYPMMVNLERETWSWRPDARSRSLPMRQIGSFHPGEGLGGAAIHWSAQPWRFFPTDLQLRSRYLERGNRESAAHATDRDQRRLTRAGRGRTRPVGRGLSLN